MKTITTFLTNGVYNNITNKVDYKVTKKETESKWYNSIEIDGIETKALRLYDLFINDMIEGGYTIFKLDNNKYVVYDSMYLYTKNNHRNDFNNFNDALEFVESLRSFSNEN